MMHAKFFAQWNTTVCTLSVYGGRGGEHKVLDAELFEKTKKVDETAYVVAVVLQRHTDTLFDRLVCREVDDAGYPRSPNNVVLRVFRFHLNSGVCAMESGVREAARSRDLYPFHRF